jgi:hypothetical protein
MLRRSLFTFRPICVLDEYAIFSTVESDGLFLKKDTAVSLMRISF